MHAGGPAVRARLAQGRRQGAALLQPALERGAPPRGARPRREMIMIPTRSGTAATARWSPLHQTAALRRWVSPHPWTLNPKAWSQTPSHICLSLVSRQKGSLEAEIKSKFFPTVQEEVKTLSNSTSFLQKAPLLAAPPPEPQNLVCDPELQLPHAVTPQRPSGLSLAGMSQILVSEPRVQILWSKMHGSGPNSRASGCQAALSIAVGCWPPASAARCSASGTQPAVRFLPPYYGLLCVLRAVLTRPTASERTKRANPCGLQPMQSSRCSSRLPRCYAYS